MRHATAGIAPLDATRMYRYGQAALILGVSESTLMRWVKEGRIPSPHYLGTTARFSAEQVETLKREGLCRAGTFKPVVSLRSMIGKKGAEAKATKRAKAQRRKPASRAKR